MSAKLKEYSWRVTISSQLIDRLMTVKDCMKEAAIIWIFSKVKAGRTQARQTNRAQPRCDYETLKLFG